MTNVHIYNNCYILLRFGGGVSQGLEEALEELSTLCLVGLLGIRFKSSRPDSESLRSFFPFDASKNIYIMAICRRYSLIRIHR